MPGDVDLDDLPYEDMLSDEEELEMKKERENIKRRELLAKVDFSRYASSQMVGLVSPGNSVGQQMKTGSHSRRKCCQCSKCTKKSGCV